MFRIIYKKLHSEPSHNFRSNFIIIAINLKCKKGNPEVVFLYEYLAIYSGIVRFSEIILWR